MGRRQFPYYNSFYYVNLTLSPAFPAATIYFFNSLQNYKMNCLYSETSRPALCESVSKLVTNEGFDWPAQQINLTLTSFIGLKV